MQFFINTCIIGWFDFKGVKQDNLGQETRLNQRMPKAPLSWSKLWWRITSRLLLPALPPGLYTAAKSGQLTS